VTAAAGPTHCPSCMTEHRAGYTICTECGTLLVDGPSPALEPGALGRRPRGSLEFAERGVPPADLDRFALEETQVILTAIDREDVADFLAALEDEGIGARSGATDDQGGVEILVHAANLVEAQAVLVEFTGEVGLVDEIGLDGEADPGMAVVTTARLTDAGRLAARLRAEGIDVRLELPSPDDMPPVDPSAAILVRAEELPRARELLGIVV